MPGLGRGGRDGDVEFEGRVRRRGLGVEGERGGSEGGGEGSDVLKGARLACYYCCCCCWGLTISRLFFSENETRT